MEEERSVPRQVGEYERALRSYARPAPAVRPAKSALLVVDMQEYFASLCASILKTTNRAIRACRDQGIAVLFTQHGHARPQHDGGMLGKWWDDLIVEGTRDHRLVGGLDVGPDEPVIAKRRYDAFFETELDRTLKDRGVEDLCLAGVMTNLCVETTARSAFVRDYRVRVLLDATATVTDELHLAALRNLAFGFAHVQSSEDWLSCVG